MTDDLGDDERRAWIGLASVNGIGPVIFWKLLAEFGNPTDVIRAAVSGDLRRWESTQHHGSLPLIPREKLAAVERLNETIDDSLAKITAAGLWALIERDAQYPQRLRDLDPAPPVILGVGEKTLLDPPRSVAIVGTRRPTPSGRLLAAQVATRLAEAGCVVVSGVAVGIDGAAHAATLAADGKTVGVIGGGHHHPGPAAHQALRERIAETGALISEHHPEVEPTHGSYPRRNRVIAALADATIVIEAPKVSGALITAHAASDIGRPVLVAPGRVGDWSTAGCLRLLREGLARPLVGLDEMIVDLGLNGDRAPTAARAPGEPVELSAGAALATLHGPQLAVARRLRVAPAGLDVLVDDTGLSPSVVSSAVTLLLMRGWVQSVGPAFLPAGPLVRG